MHSRQVSVWSPSWSAVRREDSKPDYLMHHGIIGQRWGVITKEYEPVAVDHRKSRGLFSKQRAKIRRQIRKDNLEVQKLNEERRRKTENRKKIVKTASTALAIAGAAALIYAGYRHMRLNRAKAYAGVLNNFLTKNPGASFYTSEGKKIIRRGAELAKSNSSDLGSAKLTNQFLKRQGHFSGMLHNRKARSLYNKQALKLYRSRRLIERAAKKKVSARKLAKATERIRWVT